MTPPVDVVDTGGDYRVLLDVPGVKAGDVEVKPGPSQGTVFIRASTTPEDLSSSWRVVRNERGSARERRWYTRTVALAWDADVEKAHPDVREGLLTVVVPKRKPERFDERKPANS